MNGLAVPTIVALAALWALCAQASNPLAATSQETSRSIVGASGSAASTAPSAVPHPFEPISITEPPPGSTDGNIVIGVWGRSYTFDRGPLPTSIISQHEPLLTKAPTFSVTLESGSVRVGWSKTELVREDAQQTVLRSHSELSGGRLSATTTIEYDGMIRVDLEVALDPGVSLTRFAYELSVRDDAALWFNRHVGYSYESMNVDKADLLASAGFIGDETRSFDYTPTLAIGGRLLGLEWWSDDNIDWSHPVAVRPITIRRKDTSVSLVVEPVSTTARTTDRNWRHTFAIFPFPMRPVDPSWRSIRFTSWSSARSFRQDGFQYYWIAFPSHFEARYHGLPASTRNSKQRELRDLVRSRRVGYIPYAKLTASPSRHPRTMANAERWSANKQRFTGPSPGEREVMERNNDWKAGWYSYAVCPDATDYLAWIIDESIETMIAESTDGIYFDFGSVSRMCETDHRISDRRRQQAWHYFELRDFYKALYEKVDQIQRSALITTHTNGQPRAVSAWVDYNFVGEALNFVFRNGRSWAEIQKQPELFVPDYLSLPKGFVEAQIYPPVGGTTSFLPELKFAADPKRPQRLRGYQRAFLARMLLEDATFWFANSDNAELERVMRAFDSTGSLDGARVFPYWSNIDAIRRLPGIEVTAYERKEGRLLLVVANLGTSALSTPLSVSKSVTGRNITRWKDLEDLESKARPLDSGARISIPARDFKLLMLE